MVETDPDEPFRVLDAIPLLCWMAHPDGHIYWYNRGWYEYTGTTLEQMKGWGWKAVHDPALLGTVIEKWERSLATGEAFELEFPLRRADGEFRWHLTRAVPIRDAGGHIVRWIGSNTDIEDARRARQAEAETAARLLEVAEAERAKMYAAFMSAPAFIAALEGPTHVFGFANPSYAKLVGTSRALIGRTVRQAFPELEGQGFFELLDGVYRTGVPFVGRALPVRIDRAGDGSTEEIFVNFVYEPRIGRDGKVDGILVFGFEVTDQVVALQRAEQASKEKDEFLAMLAHELRNPLAPMMNASALLKMDVGGAVQARARDVLDRQVRHLARLVDDLLETSRIARGKIELKPEALDLVALVREIVSDFAVVTRDAGVAVVVRSPDEPVALRADRTRITQTISNLLGNAVKFTPSGGSIEIGIGCTGTGEERLAELTVRDTGVGIDPAILPRIFDPFTQGDASLDRSRGGLGLGLAVAKGIVELHGGTLTAHSEGPAKGAEFRMRLPLSGVAEVRAPDRADVRRSAAGVRVMIIEDNQDQGDTMRELLESLGHVVHLERNGEHAIEAIRRFRPDVVLCDLGLPGKSGFAIASEIRRDAALRALRLVAISGYGGPDDRARAAEVGFDRHLTKPVDPAVLEELLAVR